MKILNHDTLLMFVNLVLPLTYLFLKRFKQIWNKHEIWVFLYLFDFLGMWQWLLQVSDRGNRGSHVIWTCLICVKIVFPFPLSIGRIKGDLGGGGRAPFLNFYLVCPHFLFPHRPFGAGIIFTGRAFYISRIFFCFKLFLLFKQGNKARHCKRDVPVRCALPTVKTRLNFCLLSGNGNLCMF